MFDSMRRSLLLALLSLSLHSNIAAQGYNTELISHTILSIATGDLDDDDDIDVLSGGIRNLVWYKNDGAGHFDQVVISPDVYEAQCILIEDLDADGHKDIIVADMAVNRILWFRNNDDNSFDQGILHTNTGGVAGVAITDLDADGDKDLVCAAFTTNKVYWLRNDGGFAFTALDIATGLSGATKVLANDYDGDGDIDVAAAIQTAGAVRLFRQSNGTFSNELLANMVTPRCLVQDDIDLDGDQDLLYAGASGYGYFSDNGTTFTQRSVSTYNGVRGVACGDLDADGYPDMMVADYAEDLVHWRGYSSNGTFSGVGVTLDIDFDFASMVGAADFDGDGDQDAVVASGSDLRVFINPETTSFERRPLNRILTDARGVCHGDFDNDGDVDMMAVGLLYVNWYVNDGTGKLEARIVREGPFRLLVSGGQDMKAADLDGDGDMDAVCTERTGDKVSWIENLGGGDFLKHLVYNLNDAYSCDVVDFDDDGDLDVVASDLNDGRIHWYQNNGSENFTQNTVNTTYPQPYEVRALDHDNDGDMDVLSACYSNLQQVGKLVLHRNMGNGTFQAFEIDQSAPGITSCFWVDLDGDGDQDIVATMGDQDYIKWYESSGGPFPAYTEQVLAYGVDYATYVVAADLDGDTDIDLVSSALDDRSTDWFENDGNQVFTRYQLAHGIPNGQFVGAGDIDGDGTPEIYATCAETEAVHLYRRTGISYEQVIGPEPQPCHDLFISEMVHYPGDIARALEIYNPRSVPVDLTGYALRFYPNGGHTYTTTMLTGVIAPGDVRVFVAPFSATNIEDYADQVADLWYDGQETIVLVHGDTPIDIIGRVGDFFEDDMYWLSNGVGTFYTVLVRKPTIDHGDADGTDPFLPDVEWLAYPVDDYSHLGAHSGPCSGVCTPTITLSAPAGPYCFGEDITVTATTTNAGTAPAYQWTVNDVPVGADAPNHMINGLAGNAVVRCTLSSDAACASATAVESAPLFIMPSVVPAPVASINGTAVSASPVPGAGFQWFLNGDPVPGGNSATITVTIPGDYHVVATVAGCASEASNIVTYEINTGLMMHDASGFQLAPNPTDGPLTIRGASPMQQMELWNAVGQKVLEQRGPYMDLSPFAPGVYTVVLLSGNERWTMRVARK